MKEIKSYRLNSMEEPSEEQLTYIAIDLKSFYASVECVERGLDPLDTNLVVADASRTEKTICLAVSPSLKAYGIGGRARLFEVVQRVKEINAGRRCGGKSFSAKQLKAHPDWAIDYITAHPRMALYIDYSTRVYRIYLKYVAAEDIHVYSIDEVFMDATDYLRIYNMSAHDLAMTMIRDVLLQTGVTATAGIGTNMYLAKVAMDIVAKHISADKDGVRIAELDEMAYRRQLWEHRPLTDFWRVGSGIMNRLAPYGIYTMGDIARLSLRNEDFLYQLFGVNAELLIDHAWGWEPCTMAEVKAYKPETNSMSNGQVLQCAYDTRKAEVVLREMAETMALSLLDKHLVTDQIVLSVGYDVESLADPTVKAAYKGEMHTDRYGRQVPKHSQGTANLGSQTFSARIITEATISLYRRIVNTNLLVRRLTLTANRVVGEATSLRSNPKRRVQQLDLFTDYEALERERRQEHETLDKERRLMEVTLRLKKRFGKNTLLKGTNFEDGSTQRERNKQIGGHKA